MKQKLAIFLSGAGSNARNICSYFKNHPKIEVVLLLTNKENSGAKAIGEEFGMPAYVFSREQFYHTQAVLTELTQVGADVIVLAGFLWLIPEYLLEAYPDRILNIHPALLPKYGGKGMHGRHVHEAVYANREKETGLTIHLCNREYDKGNIIFQEKVSLSETDTPESIAQAVQQLEHQFYPKVIEEYVLRLNALSS